MRKFIVCAILCGIVFQLTGCYVRFEANENPEYSHYIGKYAETTIDIIIPETSFIVGIMGSIGFSADRYRFTPRHKYITLPAGSVLKITGISSRRLEPGKMYYFACQYDADDKIIKFDYSITHIINGRWVEAGNLKFLN